MVNLFTGLRTGDVLLNSLFPFVSAGKHKGPAEAATQLCVQLPRLQDLIQYICGSPYLPSDGPIKISFTNSTLRDPESCFYNSKSASV